MRVLFYVEGFCMLNLLLATTLLGAIFDKTTGQPLVGVHVSVAGKHATSDTHGRFHITGLREGRTVLTYSSHDVPEQTVHVLLSGSTVNVRLPACSITLDYQCGGGPGGGG